MALDGLTLMVAGCFVAALVGVILVGAGAVHPRGSAALFWWGAGHLVNAVGASALTLGMATAAPLAATIGAGCIALSMALYWSGVRVFLDRRAAPWIPVVTTAIWWTATLATAGNGPRLPVGVAFVLATLLLGLACAELWRGPDDRLTARWGLIAVFALHTLFTLTGGFGLTVGGVEIQAAPSLLSWFGLIQFERLVFLIGSTLFMIVMTRERQEIASMSAARIDSLTGIANRGAFFTRADRVLRRARADGTPVALIVFDLDHFKDINDTYGHAAGDRVLQSFARIAGDIMRPGDLLGRIGGEEFAAILPGANPDTAYLIADRVRHAFSVAPKTAGVGVIHATVSGGVAMAQPRTTLQTIFEAADRALYRAKSSGRDRVERAETRLPLQPSNVIRIA